MLAGLGRGLTAALHALQGAQDVNEETIDQFLKSVVSSLIEADVAVPVVKKLRDRVRSKCLEKEARLLPVAQLKRRVHQALFQELQAILSPPVQPYAPVRGRSNIVMFVGLQGAGKTTTCTKYANYWKKKGWSVALICCDTFRAGAFDQLKQNAARIKVPFYGSYSIIDPAEIAAKGIALFKKERCEIILVDTSGRHKQEASLFEEMTNIEQATKPDEIVFVMDSHIGQACSLQAKAFRESVKVASVIVTKLDGHAKGGGAISAVAATGCPISFIGTGEGFDAFEPFEAKGFISRLLGMGDPERLMKLYEEHNPSGGKKDAIQRIVKGGFSYTDFRSQLKTMSSIGGIGSMMSMLPGLGGMQMPQGADEMSRTQLAKFSAIIDSMTPAERDCRVELCESRILRLARGSGCEIPHVKALIAQHKMMAQMFLKMGKGVQAAQKQQRRPPQGVRGMRSQPTGMSLPPGMSLPAGMEGLLGGLMDQQRPAR